MTRGDESSPRILVIDDEEGIREVLEAVLSCHGFSTLMAECGEVGVSLAAAGSPALILCDFCMPGISGLEVARRLQGLPGTAHIPFVLMSGNPTLQEEYQELGLDIHWLQKPFAPQELVRLVKAILAEVSPATLTG